MADTWREADTRKEHIDSAVKAVALMQYKLKTLCTIDSSDAWTESYFRRTNTVEATGGGTYADVRGLPQMAPFPFISQPFTKVSAVIQKYGGASVISLEAQSNATVPMLSAHILTIEEQ